MVTDRGGPQHAPRSLQSVVNLNAVQLEADVPESYLKSVRNGAPVKVTFPSIGESFDGSLEHVGQFIDPSNRTFKVSVRVPNGEDYMRPNLLSDISIQDMRTDSALVVPSRTSPGREREQHTFVLTPPPGTRPRPQADGAARERIPRRSASNRSIPDP